MASQDLQLRAIMTAESGGKNVYNYLYATNPTYYTASGYYQITNSTWKQGAELAGVDTAAYPTAISAPYDVQTKVASSLLDRYGMQPWSGSNAYGLVAQIDAGQNPPLVTGPVDSGAGVLTADQGSNAHLANWDATGGSDPNNFSTFDPGAFTYGGGQMQTAPNTIGGTSQQQGKDSSLPASSAATALAGQPGILLGSLFQFGLTTGLGQAVGSWISTAETSVGNAVKNAMTAVLGEAENMALRAMLILVGLVLVVVALWRLMDPDGSKTREIMQGAMMAA